MAKKKQKKLDFESMESLGHNPFAALGNQFNISASAEETEKPSQEPPKKQKQPILMVRMEKRKKGKMVTCVYHLTADHKDILKKLKQTLGTGGSISDDVLELQGDHRSTLPEILEGMNFKTRLGN